MTGATAANASAEIDFFALHSRKKKRIDVEMLDYDYVAKSSDVDELKGILALLRSGKEGRYPHLEKTTENRILSLLPPRERARIERMRAEPSQQELSTETHELLSWSEQIDATHRALQAHKSAARRLPPVRGATPAATEPAATEPAATEPTAATAIVTPDHTKTNSKQAIPAYDFRAWEQYDVDEALDALDAEDNQRRAQAHAQLEQRAQRQRERAKEVASLPAYVDINALAPEERAVYALHEKQKGNESFRVNELDDAVRHYTRSIAFDDSSAVVYANRAIAHLRAKRFAAAEHDCSRAVVLDPQYVKGWSRRGMTRFRRGQYADAIRDFEHALALEPTSRELAKLLEKTRAKWRDVDGTAGASQSNQTTADYVGRSDDSKASVAVEPQSQQNDEEPETPFTRFAIIEESDAESDEDDDDDSRPQQSDDDGDSDAAATPFQRFEVLED